MGNLIIGYKLQEERENMTSKSYQVVIKIKKDSNAKQR